MKQQGKVQKLFKKRQSEANSKATVTGDDIADIVAQWTGIPVKEMKTEEKSATPAS